MFQDETNDAPAEENAAAEEAVEDTATEATDAPAEDVAEGGDASKEEGSEA